MGWFNSSFTKRFKVTIANSNIDADLSDHAVWVRLSDAPSAFWTNVKSDGGDVRVATADGVEVPAYLVDWDHTAKTGSLHFKADAIDDTVDTIFYVYYGNSSASAHAENATNGRENVWRSAYEMRTHLDTDPTSSVNDATSNNNDLSGNNMEAGDVIDGGLDKAMTLDGTNEYLDSPVTFPSGDFTIMAYAKRGSHSIAFKGISGINDSHGNAVGVFYLQRDGAGGTSDKYQFSVGNSAGSLFAARSNSTSTSIGTSGFHHLVGTYDDSTKTITLYVDGVAQTTTGTLTGTRATASGNLLVGAVDFSGVVNHWPDDISEVALLSEVLSAAQIKAESVNFNTPTSFYTIGTEEDYVDGWYDPAFSARTKITLNAASTPVDMDGEAARFDLSRLDSVTNFWTTVKSDGGDVRVVASDGETEVAIDLRDFDSVAKTGWIVFDATTWKAATDTFYYIYYGNANAVGHGNTDTYGRDAAYNSNHHRVYSLNEDPSGSAPQFIDRTGNSRDATANGSMTSGDSVTGAMDNAVDFDGSNDYLTGGTAMPSADFTVYLFPKLSSLPSAFKILSSMAASSTGNASMFYLQIQSTNVFSFQVANTSDTLFAANDTTTLTTGAFQSVAGSYNNTTKKVALYVNGVEVASATLTGTRATTSGAFTVGAGNWASSIVNFLNGIIDEVVLRDDALTASQMLAIHNQVLNQTTAISVGSEETLAGFAAIFKTEWTADSKSYAIKIIDPTDTNLVGSLSIVSAIRHRKGDPSYGPREPHLESRLMFQIRDTNRTFRTAIAGKQTGDLRVLYEIDGTTVFSGFMIIAFQKSRTRDTSPRYQITAFDGIIGLQGFTYDLAGAKTTRAMFHGAFDKVGLELTSNVHMLWKHNGADASTVAVDALRNRVENMIEADASYYDFLMLLARFFVGNVFQKAGEWFFMQREGRGTHATVIERTDSAGNSLAALSTDLRFDLDRNTTDGTVNVNENAMLIEWPALARIISKNEYQNFTIKNGDFSGGSNQLYWEGVSNADVDGRQMFQNTPTEYLEQECGFTALDVTAIVANRDKFVLSYKFRVSVSPLATGTGDVEFAEVIAFDIDGNEWYMNGSSSWDASQVRLDESIDLGANAGGIVTFESAVSSANLPDDTVGFRVRLIFNDDAGGTLGSGEITQIVHNKYATRHLKPDEDSDVVRVTEERVELSTGKPGDELMETFFIGDGNDDHLAPGVFEYYDGTDWQKTQDWDGSGQTVHTKRATSIKDQEDERLVGFEFSHKYGDDVDLDNVFAFKEKASDTFYSIYIPVFIEKIYLANGKVHARSVAYKLLDATKESLVNDFIWWGQSESSPSPADANSVLKSSYPSDPSSTPWETDSEPSDKEIITIGGTGSDQILHVRVDKSSDSLYLFYVGHTGNKRLVRTDLDGNGSTTLYDPCWHLAIDRNSKRLCVNSLSPHAFVEIDYDGTTIRTLRTKTGALMGGPGYDQSSTYLFFVESNDPSPTDRIKRLTLSDLSVTNLIDITTSYAVTSVDTWVTCVDEEAGYVFMLTTGTPRVIIRFDYPSGTTITEVYNSVNTDAGLALDRLRQKVIHSDVNGDIFEMDYDGSNRVKVYDYSNNLGINAIANGHS